eukprot:GHVT01036605.1.p1 GENE.GHVT01036605.1~~GHVT01036605.1.p1  ORF type:complete len:102 (-),score=17.57 GHVT01036605.1:194-499(-)
MRRKAGDAAGGRRKSGGPFFGFTIGHGASGEKEGNVGLGQLVWAMMRRYSLSLSEPLTSIGGASSSSWSCHCSCACLILCSCSSCSFCSSCSSWSSCPSCS